MKQHFQPHKPVFELSLEEEAIAIQETEDAKTEVEQIEKDRLRLTDVSKGVGDIHQIVVSAGEVSQADQELISAVGDMMVSGTDIDPTELVSYAPTEDVIATESFLQSAKDALVKIWEMIKEGIRKAGERIKEFFSHLNARFNPIERRLQQQKAALAKEEERIKIEKAESAKAYAEYMRELESQYVVIANPSPLLFLNGEFSTHLEQDMKNAMDYLFKLQSEYPMLMVELGKHLEAAVRSYSQNAGDDWLTKLAHGYETVFAQCKSKFGFTLVDNTQGGWGRTQYLGGIGGVITKVQTSSKMSPNSTVDILGMLSNASIEIGQGRNWEPPSEIKIRTLTLEQAKSVYAAAENALRSVDIQRSITTDTHLKTQRDKIIALIDECVKKEKQQSEVLRALMRLCSKYTSLSGTQGVNIMDTATQLMSAVCKHSLACQIHRSDIARKTFKTTEEESGSKK